MSTFKDSLVQDSHAVISDRVKLFYLRRGSAEFPTALAERIARLDVKEIVWATQSESDGNLTYVCFYR